MLRCTAILLLLLSAAARAADPSDEITALLNHPTASSLDQAVPRISDLLESQPAPAAAQLRQHWLEQLIAQRRFGDAAQLARRAILLRNTDTPATQALLRLRIRALLSAGRAPEALADAKSLFNVCEMDQTAGAILLVAQCLSATHPADVEIVDRFRRELSSPATGPTLMSAIPIDPAPYDEARQKSYPGQYLIRAGAFNALIGQGNLLLLADRATEALAIFRQALAAADEDQLLPAREGVARAIKAQDGSIARANAWIRAL